MIHTATAAQALYTDWSKVPIQHIDAGIERQMIVGEKLMICRFRFLPNVVTAEHSHPHEQITMVQQGRVLFTVGGEQKNVGAGDILHFPSGVRHGATILDEEVVLIDIFSPVREDFLTPS